MSQKIYQQTPQTRGLAAHKTIDNKSYSSSTSVLQGMEVYCHRYNIAGKIDIFDQKKGLLSERKKRIKVIYDGYIYQLYAQYFALEDMGFSVKSLRLYSMDDNKSYPVEKPENDPQRFQAFEALLADIRRFNLNDNVIIKDADGIIKHQSTCYRLFALFIVGHVTITSGLLQRAKRFGFSIHLLSHNLKHYGSFQSAVEGNVVLRRKQYEFSGLNIAQHIVSNKIEQQVALLKSRRKKSVEVKKGIKLLQQYQSQLPNSDYGLQEILGVEGIASRVYFSHLFVDCDWKGRKPRVKHDITNLLLDIGYTLLFNMIDNLLNLYGFDTYQGVYHQTFYQRKSLVCDLVEPFRPIIDKQIVKAWSLGQIKETDFDYYRQQYRLQGENSRHYTSMLLKAILHHKAPMFDYVQKYYRAFMRDKPIDDYPVFRGISCS